jgi:hypothetical protein
MIRSTSKEADNGYVMEKSLTQSMAYAESIINPVRESLIALVNGGLGQLLLL